MEIDSFYPLIKAGNQSFTPSARRQTSRLLLLPQLDPRRLRIRREWLLCDFIVLEISMYTAALCHTHPPTHPHTPTHTHTHTHTHYVRGNEEDFVVCAPLDCQFLMHQLPNPDSGDVSRCLSICLPVYQCNSCFWDRRDGGWRANLPHLSFVRYR